MERLLEYEAYFGQKESVIFDLDDTLYKEWDYLREAYKAISLDVENQFAINHEEVFSFLRDEFHERGRQLLFNRMIYDFGIPETYLTRAIVILRTVHFPEKIPCFAKIVELIKRLEEDKKGLFIVTNGNIEQQRNKIAHIDFGPFMKNMHVVYADEFAPKPSPAVFNYLQEKFMVSSRYTVMIGDSPTDESFAKACEMEFICVQTILSSL